VNCWQVWPARCPDEAPLTVIDVPDGLHALDIAAPTRAAWSTVAEAISTVTSVTRHIGSYTALLETTLGSELIQNGEPSAAHEPPSAAL
jgi:hypothetical protein